MHESEKAMPQPVIIDLECGLPGELACATDRLEHTIDYGAVIERLRNIALSYRCELVEAMAHHIATVIRTEFAAPWTIVSISKIAPFPGVEVGVTLVRGESRPQGAASATPWPVAAEPAVNRGTRE